MEVGWNFRSVVRSVDGGRHAGQRVAAGGLPTGGNGPDIHTRSFRNADRKASRRKRRKTETKRTEDVRSRSKGRWEASEKEKKLHAPLSFLFRRSFRFVHSRSRQSKACVNSGCSSAREELGLNFGSMLRAIAREFKRRACLIGE